MICINQYIKRCFFYLLLVITMACSDDDGTTPPGNPNSLTGTWTVDLIEINGVIAGIPVNEETVPSGTITFNSNFTGKENYSYTIPGTALVFVENDDFTWISDGSTITFDLGDPAETIWTREVNNDSQQKGNYDVISGSTDYTITITLTK